MTDPRECPCVDPLCPCRVEAAESEAENLPDDAADYWNAQDYSVNDAADYWNAQDYSVNDE